jgi:hypothetical protein
MSASAPATDSSARARLGDAAAWRALVAGGERDAFAAAWLKLLSAQVDLALGQERVVLGAFVALRQGQSQRFGRAAATGTAEAGAPLAKVAERCLQLRRAVAVPAEGDALTAQLAVPVLLGEALEGVVALDLLPVSQAGLDVAMRLAQWGLAWFVAALRRDETQAGEGALLATRATELLASPGPGVVALQAMLTFMADRSRVQRVSLGSGSAARMQVLATSRGALAETPTDFVIALRAAMAEAATATTPVQHPQPEAQIGSAGAQLRLCHTHGAGWALSLPLAPTEPGDPWLVLTVEGEGEPSAEAVSNWQALLGMLAPMLRLRLRADDNLPAHARHVLAAEWQRWSQGRPYGRWAAGALAVLAVLFLAFAKGEHRIAARATLEGEVKRAIVAPFDGYLAEALVRPGMRVPAGALLGRLEDRELRLQRAEFQGRIAEAQHQLDEAIGKRDLSAANLGAARKAQAEAELRLVQDNLERTVLLAPFDAIVISGDPTQSIGAPLRRGDTVYELSPMDRYRVALEVDQTDFGFVQPGQPGRLVLTPLPDARWPIELTLVTPVATARDGRTGFRVDAALLEQDAALRPGMQGIAKVVVGRARYVWIWTHDAVNWARLKLWEYLP